jgi:hypothetical protein
MKRDIPSIHGRAVARRQFMPIPPVKKNDEREKIHRTDGFVKSHRNHQNFLGNISQRGENEQDLKKTGKTGGRGSDAVNGKKTEGSNRAG